MILPQIIASFTHPMNIPTTPQSLFWLFPLAVAGVIVYKAAKVKEITFKHFLKETTALFLFLIGLLILITLVIYAITLIAT
jgi:hypothetical protein